LRIVQLWPEIKEIGAMATAGFARDVTACGDRVYVAEATGGLSLWQRHGDSILKAIGRYRPRRGGVAQVVMPPPGRFALLHVGQNELQIVDVTDPGRPERILSDKHLGLFYTFPLVRDLFENRYACCLWHASGYRWYDLHGTPRPCYSGDHLEMRANFADGMTAFGDGGLLIYRGKYARIDRTESRSLDELSFVGVPGTYLSGKPTIDGSMMYLSNRVRGTIQVVDISKFENPRLIADLQVDEHPGLIVLHRDSVVIPAGYQGLIVWDRPPSS
jgi:hypothetical protein